MNEVERLSAENLCWRCDPALFEFNTTDELEDLDDVLGQSRALDAVQFGMGIRQDGYNLFVLGRSGTGKRTIVRQFLDKRSADEDRPCDWCYVQNFQHTHKPNALRLPSGWGMKLRDGMENLVEDLQTEIAASLQVEQHQSRVQQVEQEAKERHDAAFQQLAEKAATKGLQLIRTPGGFAMAPIKDGEVIGPEEFEKLAEDEKVRITNDVESLQGDLKELIERVHDWRKQAREKVKELNREATRSAINRLLAAVREKYTELPEVLEYLDSVEQDVVDNAEDFEPADDGPTSLFGIEMPDNQSFRRYEVNVLVDNRDTVGAPVIYEDHPNYQNLIGRVEHKAQMGTLTTDFTLIKPGSLHRANGGYLVVEALKLLQQPFAWDGLKRALHSQNVKIESLAESLSLVSTVSLESEPIPLDVKVVLLGERTLSDLIRESDYWASQDKCDVVSACHVEQAVDKQIHRADRLRERLQEETKRGTIFIDTDGRHVGQVNGLSVLDLGNFRFGRPSRITATTRLGKGEVIDIEREVELGGAIHSKGVLIISSFLASRYAENHPLSLSASLVFEQSYGHVEGDSASVAELCALLSSLADVPIKQSLAVTGSVNQHGRVQPIGGVNEKIEGFFDLCQARGLKCEQGVLIPAANVKHLVLRKNVVEAAAEGKFHVYAIETIDQAISLLTGVDAGQPDGEGKFPEGSINGLVASRLWKMFELRQQYSQEQKQEASDE